MQQDSCEEKGEEKTRRRKSETRFSPISIQFAAREHYTVHLRISPNCSKIPLLFANRREAWRRRRRLRIPDYFLLARNWESRVTVSELLEAFITCNCFEEIARLVTWHIRIIFRMYIYYTFRRSALSHVDISIKLNFFAYEVRDVGLQINSIFSSRKIFPKGLSQKQSIARKIKISGINRCISRVSIFKQ